MRKNRFYKIVALFLILGTMLPSEVSALRVQNPAQSAGMEELMQAILASGKEPVRRHVVRLTAGQEITEQQLFQWERATFVPQVAYRLQRNFSIYPADPKILWDVGAFTGAVAQALLPMFSQGGDRILAFERAGSRALPELKSKQARHLEVIEGDFRDFVEEQRQQPSAILASHVLYYFAGRKERQEVIDAMLNSLPPGRPLLVVLNGVRPGDSVREDLRAQFGSGRRPLDPAGISLSLADRGLEVENARVTLEVRGNLDQMVHLAALFLGDPAQRQNPELRDFLKTRTATGEPGVFAFTADQVVITASKPLPASALHLPVRLQQLLPHLSEGEQQRLFTTVSDPDPRYEEARRYNDFMAVIQRSKAFQRMLPEDQQLLRREIGLASLEKFSDLPAIRTLLGIFVARENVSRLISADSEVPSGRPLPQALLELRPLLPLLEASDRTELEGIFRKVVFESVPMVHQEELGRVHLFMDRLFGSPRQPRDYPAAKVMDTFPFLRGFIRGAEVPTPLRRALEGEGTLRLSEIQGLLRAHGAEHRTTLPLSLEVYRDALQRNPPPRLLPYLPPLDDPSELWDPFQIQLLQDYAALFRASLMEEAGEAAAAFPAWGEDAGALNGMNDFPELLRQALANAASFTERVLLVAEYLQWSDQLLARSAGVDPGVVESWRRQGTKQPKPVNVLRFSAALRVHPVFLLTGKPVREAMMERTIGPRAALLLQAQGYSQEAAGSSLGITQAGVQRALSADSWDRESLFLWAELLRVEPTFLEFGAPPAPLRRFNPKGDFGYSRKLSNQAKAYASRLLGRLLAALREERGDAVEAWRPYLEPAEGYFGLVGKFLSAYPDTWDQCIAYGFPADIAGKMRRLDRLTPVETKRLALHLLRVYDGLEQLFLAAPEYHPSPEKAGGYGNKSQNVRHPWHLVGRGMTAERFVAIAGRVPLSRGQLKSKVFVNPNPEKELMDREEIAREQEEVWLRPGQPALFSAKAIRNYVWFSANPAEALRQAARDYAELLELANRGWVRRYRPERQQWVEPETLSKQLTTVPHRSGPYLEAVRRRMQELRSALREDPYGPQLQDLAEAVEQAGLRAYAPDEGPAPMPLLLAEDLLNRVVAYRVGVDPAFGLELTPQAARGLVRLAAERLQQLQPAGTLPATPEQLEPLVAALGGELAAGAEETWAWKNAEDWQLLRGGTARAYLSGLDPLTALPLIEEAFESGGEPLMVGLDRARELVKKPDLLLAVSGGELALVDLDAIRRRDPSVGRDAAEMRQRALADLYTEPVTPELIGSSPEGLQPLFDEAAGPGAWLLAGAVIRRAVWDARQVSPGPVIGLAVPSPEGGLKFFFQRGWDRPVLRRLLSAAAAGFAKEDSRRLPPLPGGVRPEQVEAVLRGRISIPVRAQLSADESRYLDEAFRQTFQPRQTGLDRFLERPARPYPLLSDENVSRLLAAGAQLSGRYPRGRIYSLGRSPLWIVESARLLEQEAGLPSGRYGYVPFSGRWRKTEADPVTGMPRAGRDAPSQERVAAYRAFLQSIQMDPESIVLRARAGEGETVLVEYAQQGGSLNSFLGLLLDWAAELQLSGPIRGALLVHLLEDPRLAPVTLPEGVRRAGQPMDPELMDGLSDSDVYGDSLGVPYPQSRWLVETPAALGEQITRPAALVRYRLVDALASRPAGNEEAAPFVEARPVLVSPGALEGAGSVPAMLPLLVKAAPFLSPAQRRNVAVYTENGALAALLGDELGYLVFTRLEEAAGFRPPAGLALYLSEPEWLLRGQLQQVTETIVLSRENFRQQFAMLLQWLDIPLTVEQLELPSSVLEQSA